MKKSIKILLTFLIVIILASAAIVIWQYDNISALIKGLNNTTEDLAVKMDDHRSKVKTEVKNYVPEPIEDISAEDEKKLLQGKMTIDDIAEKYNLPIEYMKDEEIAADVNNDKKPGAVDTSDNEKNVNATDVDSNTTKNIEKEIGDSVARMYALKAKYVNKLGELERDVIDQYSKLPESKQNKEEKKKLVMSNVDHVAKLERTCDADVDKVISALEKSLKESGGDLEIIKILKDAYNDEKELKKSYYLSLYNE